MICKELEMQCFIKIEFYNQRFPTYLVRDINLMVQLSIEFKLKRTCKTKKYVITFTFSHNSVIKIVEFLWSKVSKFYQNVVD